MTPLNVIMLGPPGAGKGTQAARISREYGIPKISTGDILRDAVTHGTAVGRDAKETMNAGHLVGDEVVVSIVRQRLMQPDTKHGFVLDGFPRTVAQARALDEMVAARGSPVVLIFDVPIDVLVERLHSRRICATCGTTPEPGLPPDARCPKCGGVFVQRADDEEEVVRERLRIYFRQIEPLVKYYEGSPTFCCIDGTHPPEQVTESIRATLSLVRTGNHVDVSP
jgi:adenylate kinase